MVPPRSSSPLAARCSETAAKIAFATVYKGRLLGSSEIVSAPIRCEKEFTGNNVALSNELRERTCLIRLDAKMPTPADRSGFRYPMLLDTVERWRPVLVWACLVLIKAWVAAGRPRWTGKPMGVLGGVLEHAGIKGYLLNRSLLKEALGDDAGEANGLVQFWWDTFADKAVAVGMLPRDVEAEDYTDDAVEHRRREVVNLCDLALAQSATLTLPFSGRVKTAWHIEVGKMVKELKGPGGVLLDVDEVTSKTEGCKSDQGSIADQRLPWSD